MLYRVEAFGCEFIASENLARMIDGYAALCGGQEISLERALAGMAFEAEYFTLWEGMLAEWEADHQAD